MPRLACNEEPIIKFLGGPMSRSSREGVDWDSHHATIAKFARGSAAARAADVLRAPFRATTRVSLHVTCYLSNVPRASPTSMRFDATSRFLPKSWHKFMTISVYLVIKASTLIADYEKSQAVHRRKHEDSVHRQQVCPGDTATIK